MSILNVVLPCSRLRTKQRPTPDFIASSSWVRPYSLRNDFTTVDNFVLDIAQLYLFGCKITQKIAYYIISYII